MRRCIGLRQTCSGAMALLKIASVCRLMYSIVAILWRMQASVHEHARSASHTFIFTLLGAGHRSYSSHLDHDNRNSPSPRNALALATGVNARLDRIHVVTKSVQCAHDLPMGLHGTMPARTGAGLGGHGCNNGGERAEKPWAW